MTETFIRNEINFMRSTDVGIEVCSLREMPPRVAGALHFLRSRLLRDIYCQLVDDPFAPSRKKVVGAVLRACRVAQQRLDATHIHAHFLGMPAMVAYCLSRLTGATYSLTAHAHDIYVPKTPRTVIEHAFPRFTCTEDGQRYLISKYGQGFELVRHGMDIKQFASLPSRPRKPPCRLLAVGRLVEKKGFEYLIEACHFLSSAGFRYACTIIGEGQERSALEKLVNSRGLGECVFMPGSMPHDDVLQHYRHADIFVAPFIVARDGDRDGVPNTILEAMASQVPVIATDAGAISEVVKHGMNGLLILQKRPDQIADACIQLWEDADLSDMLAEHGRVFVEKHFDCTFWNTKLLTAFRGLFVNKTACCQPTG